MAGSGHERLRADTAGGWWGAGLVLLGLGMIGGGVAVWQGVKASRRSQRQP